MHKYHKERNGGEALIDRQKHDDHMQEMRARRERMRRKYYNGNNYSDIPPRVPSKYDDGAMTL